MGDKLQECNKVITTVNDHKLKTFGQIRISMSVSTSYKNTICWTKHSFYDCHPENLPENPKATEPVGDDGVGDVVGIGDWLADGVGDKVGKGVGGVVGEGVGDGVG